MIDDGKTLLFNIWMNKLKIDPLVIFHYTDVLLIIIVHFLIKYLIFSSTFNYISTTSFILNVIKEYFISHKEYPFVAFKKKRKKIFKVLAILLATHVTDAIQIKNSSFFALAINNL